MNANFTKNKSNFLIIFVVFLVLVFLSFLVHSIFYSYAVKSNLEKAKQFSQELIVTREYLANIAPKIKIEDKNISKFALTPAYVGAYIMHEISQEKGIIAKQTSLKYRNPKNKPDSFEIKVLKKYEANELKDEYYEVSAINNQDYLRYTYPLYIKKECLSCHGTPYKDVKESVYKELVKDYGDVAFNYKEGDFRGIISVAIDMSVIESTVKDLVFKMVLIFLFLFIVIIVILVLEKYLIYQPQIDKIERLNETLEQRVKEEIEKNREKEHILIEQSKLAQMGEMINMIAHQWRQPLNVISSVAIRLNLKNELGKLEQDDIKNISGLIGSKVQEMSNIINDFMEFNKPDANSKFKLIEAVKTVIDMSEAQFKSRGIEIEVDVDENLEVFHNLKSIEHVLLNLLTNSRDAFAENKDITTRLIKIYTTQNDNGITLSVEDNAGGIKKDILHKIFNPYFTTKEQGKGTGIGLYMSKKMVESVSNAKLSVEVIEDRTIFYILFPAKIVT